MANLPEELTEKILLLLPFKTLVRCSCVSKSWNKIIKSSEFSKIYLSKSMDANTDRCLVLATVDFRPTRFYKLAFDDNDNMIGPMRPIPQPIPHQTLKTKIMGHSNGVICVCNEACSSDIHLIELALWNPSIHTFKRVPNLPADMIPALPANAFRHFTAYGFAYKSTTDDYQIVQILQCWNFEDYRYTHEAMLWSSRLNSWKRIDPGLPGAAYDRFEIEGRLFWSSTIDSPFVNGHLHWLMFDISHHPRQIVAFDIENEEFLDFGLPASAFLDQFGRIRLDSVGDHLYLVDHHVERVDVWRMNEHRNGHSWNRLYTMSNAGERIYSLFPELLSRTGRGILHLSNVAEIKESARDCRAETKHPRLCWFNPRTEARQVVLDHAVRCGPFQVTSFVENFRLGDGDRVPPPS